MKLLTKALALSSLLAVTPGHAASPDALDVGCIKNLTDHASRYDNSLVTFETCVLVTPHGMAFFGWDANLDESLVFFEKPQPPQSDAAYDAVVAAGFRATYKQLVSLTVTGRFQHSPDELPHFTIDVLDAQGIRFIQDPRPGRR